MLQIVDICKEYRTGLLVQKALDHVSLDLRENEFVAVLGPSGSGKTTLLNIIGGLDRYDSGDLIIDGVSTKKYRDRDWDSYRNHTVGFVFQSYNLIPHQTVLSNVELALTIGGISRKERRRRAVHALEQVGLGDQLHKIPSQMSGGQMQRVAIARALVGDPKILLADEPTGALDSETSVQIMELLKEVAKDRLVVMVTHNPELAEQYATRIVRLKDGVITADSDPVTTALAAEGVHRNLGKASMSFLTALSLSFNNLRTKMARTILVALAGSIGIIGIALILALSTGANQYIHSIEENTLSEYPLEILRSTISSSAFASMMGARMNMPEDAEVVELQTVTGMLSNISTNDLASLKKYFDSGESGIGRYAKSVEYKYGVTPLIYRETENGPRQVNPDTVMSSLGYGGGGGSDIFSSMMNMNAFLALPEEEMLYRSQYELKAGRWPENSGELVVVITQNGSISDLALYAAGLKDASELDDLLERYKKGEPIENDAEPGTWRYEDFLGITFRRVNAADCYVYDSEYRVWKDKTEDKAYMQKMVSGSQKLTIVGVAAAAEDSTAAMLTPGIYYPVSLAGDVMHDAGSSEMVRQQLADPDTNVITGRAFDDPGEEPAMDLSSMFAVNEDAMAEVFRFDPDKLSLDPARFAIDPSALDLSGLTDGSAFAGDLPELSAEDIAGLFDGISVDPDREEFAAMVGQIVTGFTEYSKNDPSTDVAGLGPAMRDYLSRPEVMNGLTEGIRQLAADTNIDSLEPDFLGNTVSSVMSGFPAYLSERGAEDLTDIGTYLENYLQTDAVRAILSSANEELRNQLAGVQIPEEEVRALLLSTVDGYEAYAAANSLPTAQTISDAFRAYMQTDEGQKILREGIQKSFHTEEIAGKLSENAAALFAGYAESAGKTMEKAMRGVVSQLSGLIQQSMSSAISDLTAGMEDAFSVNPDALADAITVNMSEEDLQELMRSIMTAASASYEENLEKLGYADERDPYEIVIYPKDFESKNRIVEILDAYNARAEEEGHPEKAISYTDTVATLMSSVTDIVNAISYVLIAFVAISLVVSSIMIGVITYISVLERRKEIGILRAIGASKRNVSSIFNAETFIIGLLAGLLGVGISLLLIIPINMIVHRLAKMNSINAVLPAAAAGILVLLSVGLTMLGGLIPSRKASRQDPVLALRSE
ncbi:MAG: ABC transporter ATP-binding protein/permease [Oscillospiraceae bacterium]|nr:ABC transporter ATP-binding protein/permease [Oscillospiraceae bacterium]